mmetsp:Transcript_3171/g.8103  ORF Transcript_3171/g.8103 Transcript_3171/m.8103 type:complete len:90 (-) Transcript_3171:186-455(-)
MESCCSLDRNVYLIEILRTSERNSFEMPRQVTSEEIEGIRCASRGGSCYMKMSGMKLKGLESLQRVKLARAHLMVGRAFFLDIVKLSKC